MIVDMCKYKKKRLKIKALCFPKNIFWQQIISEKRDVCRASPPITPHHINLIAKIGIQTAVEISVCGQKMRLITPVAEADVPEKKQAADALLSNAHPNALQPGKKAVILLQSKRGWLLKKLLEKADVRRVSKSRLGGGNKKRPSWPNP